MKPRFRVTTLGCKVNQFETDAMAEALERHGWRCAAADEPVDVCIVNTCTVTGRASMQSRQMVRQLMRRHPQARIIVTGCYAQTAPDEIEAIGGAADIIGHADKSEIPRLIIESFEKADPAPIRRVSDIQKTSRFAMPPAPAYGRRTRPYLKIQDGCNRFCTYCIVPHARGPSRSMPLTAVRERLADLGARGYREVVLTGIHLGAYGRDLSPPLRIVDLLGRIAADEAVARVRLSSIEPDEVTPELVAIVAGNSFFCPHWHLPLQSGDDQILRRMRRPYTAAAFAATVRRIRAAMPDAAIGADILVGFPGETPAAFERTRALIDELPLAYLHVFPFSARPGTPAFHFPDPVSAPVIKTRTAVLRALGRQKKLAFATAHREGPHRVLVQSRRDRRTGRLKGLSANYLSFLVDGGDDLMNRIVDVQAQNILEDGVLTGHPLPPDGPPPQHQRMRPRLDA
jgi:threonylcarbamoyladenosine tRNA methylthiotransferase MtaB